MRLTRSIVCSAFGIALFALVACGKGRSDALDADAGASAGAHCDSTMPAGTLFGYCVPNATECADGASPSCNGTKYTDCVNGRNASYDGATLGLTCTPNGCG